ncbi:MAG: type II toxin-antitoxin system VapC family toxin [Acidobacteriaceae bacterium]
MDLLLDTHSLLWNLQGDRRLKPAVREAIANSENHIFISMASLWEMGIKSAQGRLILPSGNIDYVLDYIRTWRMEVLPIALEHVRAASGLPFHHGDPFDRMLVAQANVEHMRLVTNDAKILLYQVDILWK